MYLTSLIQVLVFIALAGPVAGQQQGSNSMDAFVAREMKRTPFKVVHDMWSPASRIDLPATEAYVRSVENLELNVDQLLAFGQRPEKGIRLVVPYGTNHLEIDLVAFDILAEGFQVATIANGTVLPVTVPTGKHYRGVVAGMPGSLAAFSFFNDRVYGVFSIPGVGNFNLVRNTLIADDMRQYLLYNDKDLLAPPSMAGCATDKLPQIESLTNGAESRNTYDNCRDVEVYLLADYATYLDAGSSVSTVVAYLTAVFNSVATIYRNEGIYTSIKQINVNTTSDVYQTLAIDSYTFLITFGAATTNNLFGADLAHLISTRSGNMGGIAWLNTLCSPYNAAQSSGPYAFSNIDDNGIVVNFPTFSWNVEVIAHEMGHNLGSPHTHNCSWPGGAIDGCVTLEGSCAMPVPQYPVDGGTIMSYCHLVNGVGINFSNGFGPLPGNVIRNKVNTSSCVAMYAPDTALAIADSVLTANRECTNAAGITTYWYDNNNAIKSDDRVVLKIVKGTNDIGDLDDVDFEVVTATTANYGNGSGTVVDFPAGVAVSANNVAMSRYWYVTPVDQPQSAVEVRFPFTDQDILDISGNISSTTDFSDLLFYKFDGAVDPDPTNGFSGATTANTHVLTYTSGAPSTTSWAHTTSGNTRFARFLVDNFSGGGGFSTTNVPLPLEWLSFRGIVRERNVWLNWEIETSESIQEFMVAHSPDGSHYTDFAVLRAKDKADALYEVHHRQPVQGNNYYRLSYRTIDGKQVIAGFTQVNLHGQSNISIYPNPAQEVIYINMGGYGNGAIRILDIQGRIVYQQNGTNGLVKINAQDLAPGTYLVQVVNGKDVVNRKVLIQ